MTKDEALQRIAHVEAVLDRRQQIPVPTDTREKKLYNTSKNKEAIELHAQLEACKSAVDVYPELRRPLIEVVTRLLRESFKIEVVDGKTVDLP